MFKCMKPHWVRFTISLEERNRDLAEGHSWVNLFAEGLRCLRVPERIIKARIPILNVGLPHFLSILPPWGVMYAIILGAYISLRTKK